MMRVLLAVCAVCLAVEGAVKCTSVNLVGIESCGTSACQYINSLYAVESRVGVFTDGEIISTALNETLCLFGALNTSATYVCSVEGGVATADSQVCVATQAPDTEAPPSSDDGISAGVVVLIVLLVVIAIVCVAACIFWSSRAHEAGDTDPEERDLNQPRKDGLTAPLFDSVLEMDANAHQRAATYYHAQPTFKSPKCDPDLSDFV